MKKLLLLPVMTFAITIVMAYAQAGRAAAQEMTAVIDIDNRPVSIAVDDLAACKTAIANRINDLKALYKNSLTVGSVIGECFSPDGKLAVSGRCGTKMGSGQITYLCVPDLQ